MSQEIWRLFDHKGEELLKRSSHRRCDSTVDLGVLWHRDTKAVNEDTFPQGNKHWWCVICVLPSQMGCEGVRAVHPQSVFTLQILESNMFRPASAWTSVGFSWCHDSWSFIQQFFFSSVWFFDTMVEIQFHSDWFLQLHCSSSCSCVWKHPF